MSRQAEALEGTRQFILGGKFSTCRNGSWGLFIRTKLNLGVLCLLASTFLANSETMLLLS